jgi:uracil DNA glycosylase
MNKEEIRTFWAKKVVSIYEKETSRPLLDALKQNGANKEAIVPENRLVYRALRETDPDNINVVIVGQDPYPSGGHANGRLVSFS